MRESDNDDNIVGASSTIDVCMCLQKNRRDERERERESDLFALSSVIWRRWAGNGKKPTTF